jgi:hypothetical protein
MSTIHPNHVIQDFDTLERLSRRRRAENIEQSAWGVILSHLECVSDADKRTKNHCIDGKCFLQGSGMDMQKALDIVKYNLEVVLSIADKSKRYDYIRNLIKHCITSKCSSIIKY